MGSQPGASLGSLNYMKCVQYVCTCGLCVAHSNHYVYCYEELISMRFLIDLCSFTDWLKMYRPLFCTYMQPHKCDTTHLKGPSIGKGLASSMQRCTAAAPQCTRTSFASLHGTAFCPSCKGGRHNTLRQRSRPTRHATAAEARTAGPCNIGHQIVA